MLAEPQLSVWGTRPPILLRSRHVLSGTEKGPAGTRSPMPMDFNRPMPTAPGQLLSPKLYTLNPQA
eukprot:2195680-Rhodomonas_salina.5